MMPVQVRKYRQTGKYDNNVIITRYSSSESACAVPDRKEFKYENLLPQFHDGWVIFASCQDKRNQRSRSFTVLGL